MAVYVSDLLTVTPAPVDATPASTRALQWLRGSTTISGATTTTYTTTADDIGSSIFARQSETNFLGTTTATSAATETVQAFDPIRLFSASEPGVWYDPNDISTLFKGVTNLTPVTAPGDTVSAMLDKSRGLVLGPQLVNNGTFAGGTTGWDNVTASLSVVDGEGIVNGGSYGYVRQSIATVVGKTYQVTCLARKGTSNSASISLGGVAAETTSATATPLFCLYTATGTSAFLWMQVSSAGTAFYDNISVKELPGNHATQATTASQPTYGIVPAGGRRNILEQTEDLSNAYWTAFGVASRTVSGSFTTVTENTSTTVHFVSKTSASSLSAYTNFTLSASFRAGTRRYVQFQFDNGTQAVGVVIDTQAWSVTPITGAGTVTSYSIVEEDASTYRVTVSGIYTSGTFVANAAVYGLSSATQNSVSYTGDGSTVIVGKLQLEQSATATPYQRVTTQHDVTEAGVASLGYLYFDGTDDFMSNNTLSAPRPVDVFTAYMTYNAGKTQAAIDTRNNTNRFFIGPNDGSNTFTSDETGSISLGLSANTKYVISALADSPSGDDLRVNGTSVGTRTGGTWGFDGLSIGDIRNAVAAGYKLQGHIYGVIIRGASSTTAQINAAEAWLNDRTGAY